MKLTRDQNMLMQIYRRASGITEERYREILREASGCASARSPYWSQIAYDFAMAALEAALFAAVASGQVADPIAAGSRHIRQSDHWRRRVHGGPGAITPSQLWKIKQLWNQLEPHLEPGQRNLGYFAGIARQSTGRHEIGLSAVTRAEAAKIIDALLDRLHTAHESVA